MNDDDRFYFVVYIDDRKALTVIDLDYAVSWQVGDWDRANDETFTDHEDAINNAKALCDKYSLAYKLFDSRYDERLNENNFLTL